MSDEFAWSVIFEKNIEISDLKNKIEAYELFIKHLYENSHIEFTANDVIDETEKSLTKEQKVFIDELIGVDNE